jgi:hypothetical protein
MAGKKGQFKGVGVACPPEIHKAMSANDEIWSKLKYVGVMDWPQANYTLELRNCACGSTISRKLPRK